MDTQTPSCGRAAGGVGGSPALIHRSLPVASIADRTAQEGSLSGCERFARGSERSLGDASSHPGASVASRARGTSSCSQGAEIARSQQPRALVKSPVTDATGDARRSLSRTAAPRAQRSLLPPAVRAHSLRGERQGWGGVGREVEPGVGLGKHGEGQPHRNRPALCRCSVSVAAPPASASRCHDRTVPASYHGHSVGHQFHARTTISQQIAVVNSCLGVIKAHEVGGVLRITPHRF
ncbi:unnamed protein product, partial [Lampetra planeri]